MKKLSCLLLAVVCSAVTACGSSPYPPEPTPTLGLRDPHSLDARAKFAACMRQHGMKVSDPDLTTGTYTVDVADKDYAPFTAAQRSCWALAMKGRSGAAG